MAEEETQGTSIEIPVFTYHTHPPFIIESGQGLSYDLAKYLSRKSGGRYNFLVKPMSRPRVNKMIKEAKIGIVPWVNPVWFKDKDETIHMWSKGALMRDGNAVISHQDLKIAYEGPQSLDGLVFGGVRAHVYKGIDDYIEKTGGLKRVDAENHIDNFRKLVKHRIDATVTPKSCAEWIIRTEDLQGELFISPKPHSIFKRRIIFINEQKQILTFIETVLKDMPLDHEWGNIIGQYR